ncbi:small, acid-soluble spore protein, alpha/beta type [Bacillus sp. 1A]
MFFSLAQESGVQLGADTISRTNGSVDSKIIKRLVSMAKQEPGHGFTR